jgi:hypothetical protein
VKPFPHVGPLLARTEEGRRLSILRNLLRVAVLGLGATHAWAGISRQAMNEDGISYLDMGDAYLRGDWEMAVNTVWSPLYGWLLGTAATLVGPSLRWEFPLVHMVNFVIFVGAMLAFEFLWNELDEVLRRDGEDDVSLPDWAWISVGYFLFAWSTLNLIRMWAVVPDMMVAALLFLAGGLLLRISSGRASRWTSVLFGTVLGLGYLTKTAMFPVAWVFLGVSYLGVRGRPRAGIQSSVAALSFLVVAGPFVAILSAANSRATIGQAGALTYIRYVNGAPYPHWRPGTPARLGTPAHPARLIFADPEIYEFGDPVGGTYPLSYDPSYWYEGVTPQLRLGDQAAALLSSLRFYFDLFIRQLGGVVGILLLLLAARPPPRWRSGEWSEAFRVWCLAFVAVAGLAMYALVYVEGRYVGGFLVLLAGNAVARVRLPDTGLSRRLLAVGGGGLVLFLALEMAAFNVAGLSRLAPGAIPVLQSEKGAAGRPAGSPPAVAEALLEAGIRPGDRIAYVGYAFGAYFARLARVRVVAEVPEHQASKFWALDPPRREAALERLAETGAAAIVAERPPNQGPAPGWNRLGQTDYYVRPLR